jgi:hypothetical protein
LSAANIVALIVGIVGTGGLTSVIGFVLGGRNERKKDERALLACQAEDARTFQRDTLLQVHDMLYKFNLTMGKIVHADAMRYRETGRYGSDALADFLLPDEIAELLTSIHKLCVRIFDPELRDQIREYLGMSLMTTDRTTARVPGDDASAIRRAKLALDEAVGLYGPLEEAIGVAIRMQFPASDVHPTEGLTFRLPPGADGQDEQLVAPPVEPFHLAESPFPIKTAEPRGRKPRRTCSA